MNLRDVYEAISMELNKEGAPSLTLEQFNYFFNKAVIQKFNTYYGLNELNQQSIDDMMMLLKSTVLQNKSDGIFILPSDYYHPNSCIVTFTNYTCNGNLSKISARRSTPSTEASILNNYYYKPDIKRPYYIINNNKEVRISCGSYTSNIREVELSYYKVPDKLELTFEHIDSYTDDDIASIPVLEYQDYVIYEIINKMLELILENNSNPRIQTNIEVNKSIIPPQIQK